MSQIIATVGRGLCMKKEDGKSGTFFCEEMLLSMHRTFPRGIRTPRQSDYTVDFYIAEIRLNWTLFPLKEIEKKSLRKAVHDEEGGGVVKNLWRASDNSKPNIYWLYLLDNMLKYSIYIISLNPYNKCVNRW